MFSKLETEIIVVTLKAQPEDQTVIIVGTEDPIKYLGTKQHHENSFTYH